MNLPVLPTGNLYKFMALSGLLILGTCSYFLWSLTFELDELLVDTQKTWDIVDAKLDYLEKDLGILSENSNLTKPATPGQINHLLDIRLTSIDTGKQGTNVAFRRQAKFTGVVGLSFLW